MAAYADHGLSLAERARVEAHLASCPQCIALLAGVVRTVAEVSALYPDATVEAEATPLLTWRMVRGALAAAAAVIAVLVVPPKVGPWLERDAGLVSLVDSVGEQRSVLGRLTGGFPHAPLGVPPAGGQGGQAAGTDRVLLTAGKIRESFGDWETPSRLHALGVAQLLAGRYDDAAQSLLAASREQPANAQYLSDLATVHLERARLGLRPDDLPRALAAADRARRLDPSLREAWFNRALVATALSLTDQAKTAWTEYLKRDSVSPWAGEARARLEELSKPTPAMAWTAIEGRLQQSIDQASADEAVRTQTTEARNYIENVLFVEWANAVLSGGSGAAELERLRVMAEAMLRVAGDALYRDAVAAIDRAEARGNIRDAAATHHAFASASQLLSEDRFADAAPGLQAAHNQFLAAGSPMAELAALGLGTVAYVAGSFDEADRVLALVQAAGTSKGYAYAAGRANWLRGMTAFAHGRLGDAQSLYEDSLSTFERMGDIEQAGGAHNLLSGLAYHLGDKVTEWRHRNAAIAALPVSRSLRFKYSTLAATAAATRVDNPEVALAIQESVLSIATEWGREAAVAEVLAQRGSTLIALSRNAEAAQVIQQARQRLALVGDPAFRANVEFATLAAESDLLRASSPSQAAAAAQRAIDAALARGDRGRLPQFHLRLAKANIVWGKLDEAERALLAGIQAFDERRAGPAAASGISTLDESWQLFESAVRLAMRRGDHERAFSMAERARPTIGGEPQAALSLAAARGMARPDEAIVALNQFEDELAIWVIKNDKVSLVIRPIRRYDAQRLIERQREEIRLEATRPDASAELFDEIIRPVALQLRGVRRIAFVPDTTYQDASFSAFWDKSESRFLIEDVMISLAPNVSVLGAAADNRLAATDEPLIVAGSGQELVAHDIANEYRAPQVLTGPAATRSRFLADARNRAIVHLAVPTRQNDAYPTLSRVLFSDEPGRRHSGAMLGQDIASRPMPETHLVVLDEIGNEHSYRGESSFNLARAFLAAGVPAVLGTLPGADENATRELMVAFHRQLAGQASAVEALTRLQRNVLQRNGRRIGAWSALVMYGSDR